MESPSMKKQCSTGNCPLPEHLILQEILPRLPTKSVVAFKSVSKTWLSLISQHSSFIAAAKHSAGEKPGSIIGGRYRPSKNLLDIKLFFLNHNNSNLVELDTSYIYKKTPANVLMIGSCNGLVCLRIFYSDQILECHDDIVLWNPATREVNYLRTGESWLSRTNYAIGYDAHSGVVKVVRMEESFEDAPLVKVQIFATKSGQWKHLKPFTPAYPYLPVFRQKCFEVTFDGAIYWKLYPFNVLSFDLSKEEFREFEGPLYQIGHDTVNYDHYNLMNWKGLLGAAFVKPGGTEIQVWLKNKDSRSSDSGWKNISTLQLSLGPISLAGVVRGDEIIRLFCGDDDDDETEDIFYDLVANKKIELEPSLQKLNCYYIRDYFYTLVSPN